MRELYAVLLPRRESQNAVCAFLLLVAVRRQAEEAMLG